MEDKEIRYLVRLKESSVVLGERFTKDEVDSIRAATNGAIDVEPCSSSVCAVASDVDGWDVDSECSEDDVTLAESIGQIFGEKEKPLDDGKLSSRGCVDTPRNAKPIKIVIALVFGIPLLFVFKLVFEEVLFPALAELIWVGVPVVCFTFAVFYAFDWINKR